ncbi:MAG: bifunctional demethylmenaquinone methyltransferase/2-methoxy-6-polyprenyl-1,4-benzoquinol methylase UbiE [Sphingobacteriia bacterium]|nr:bifunctional demethylmenaquinone methyltransferase/2-methoxy-6-polyprenyl-1,4-benzoquinol methylase UbiE [Sphingobacteriia bacterium]
MNKNDDNVDFGYKKVNSKEKPKLVSNIFSNVSNNYDLMNDLMSAGLHRMWKNRFITHIPKFDIDYLDVASGTGDIALRFLQEAKSKNKESKVVLSDYNIDMLRIGKDKLFDKGFYKNINFLVADGEKLPFPDNSFDLITIAFGIRNFTNIDAALKEFYRVLKPFGKFLCLEFSKVNSFIEIPYNFYSFNVIPKIGKLVADDEDAYQYLVESIRKFPSQKQFANMMITNNFKKVDYENLSFGIAAIHSGYKL